MSNNILSCNKEDFSYLAETILKQGNCIRFRAEGRSMSPSIRNGDIIEVGPDIDDITPGDIILYRSKENTPVVHRVIKINESIGILTKGDSSLSFDNPITHEHVLGRVIEVKKSGLNFRHVLSRILRQVQGLRLYNIFAKVILKPENVKIEQSAERDEAGQVTLHWSVKKDKRLVGHVDLSPNIEKDNSVWIMSSLWVHYRYRKIGIGKRLVKEVLVYLKNRGADEVGLYVSPSNIAAINLYKGFGFEIADNNHGFKDHIYLNNSLPRKDTENH